MSAIVTIQLRPVRLGCQERLSSTPVKLIRSRKVVERQNLIVEASVGRCCAVASVQERHKFGLKTAWCMPLLHARVRRW